MNDSGTTEAGHRRIEDLIRLGMTEAATAECRELLSRNPSEATAWFYLGTLALLSNNARDAEAALRRAITLDPNKASIWHNLSYALRVQEMCIGSRGLFSQSSGTGPIQSRPLGRFGQCPLPAGKNSRGRDMLTTRFGDRRIKRGVLGRIGQCLAPTAASVRS